MRAKGAAFLALVATFAFSGCSSFDRDWKAAERQPALKSFSQADAFTGRWDGRWTSGKHQTSTGFMGGRLRCILTKLDDRRYEARFKANWLAFASGYTTIFNVERRPGELRLQGEHRMSAIFGGLYRYEGRVTPDHFSARYDSSYDHGTFELTRPQRGR